MAKYIKGVPSWYVGDPSKYKYQNDMASADTSQGMADRATNPIQKAMLEYNPIDVIDANKKNNSPSWYVDKPVQQTQQDIFKPDNLTSPLSPQKPAGFLQSLGDSIIKGASSFDKNMVGIPLALEKGADKLLSLLPKSVYDSSKNVVLNKLQQSNNFYDSQNSGLDSKPRTAAGKVAYGIGQLIPEGLGTAAELALPIPKVGTIGKGFAEGLGQPVENALTKLVGNSKPASYLTNAARQGAEFAGLNALQTGLEGGNTKDILNSAGQGALGGAVFGTAGKALGDLGKSAFPKWETTFAEKQGLNNPKGLPFYQEKTMNNTVKDVANEQIPLVRTLKDRNTSYQRVQMPDGTYDIAQNTKMNNIPQFSGLINQPHDITRDVSYTFKKPILPEFKPGEVPLNNLTGPLESTKLQGNTNTPLPNNLEPKLPKNVTSEDIMPNKFQKTVANDLNTSPFLNNAINKDMQSYMVKHNNDTLKAASDFVNNNYDQAIKLVKDEKSPFTAETSAMAQVLLSQAQKEGRWNDAVDIVQTTAKKGTNAGQAIQALSMYGRLTPEGMLRYANRQIENANRELPANNKISLTPELTKSITADMGKIQGMPDGQAKSEEVAKVLANIDEALPKSVWQKVSTVQAMAQLLNPKTINRNVIGNGLFGGLENVSNVVGTSIDTVVSKLTGQRTTILPSLSTQAKGLKDGFLQGVKEAYQGINTEGMAGKYDLNTSRTFNRNSLLGKLETGMNVTLQAPDRAFANAARQESLRQQMKIAGVDKPTDGMIQVADQLAKYRTFQDNNGISKGFQDLKNGLNSISSFFTGTKDWGLGDLVLKYAKTPANILARAIDYSPVGLLKTLRSIPTTDNLSNQKTFVDSLSRSITGTGLIAAGYGLAKLGIITGAQDKDKDVSNFNQQIGKSPYSINFNALKRFIASGNPEDAKPKSGDTFTTWDWAAPAGIILGVGANVGKTGNAADLLTTAADASVAGMNTLFAQPLLTGVQTLTGYGNIPEGLKNTLLSIPSSFTPTLGKQIGQTFDNNSRLTYDPNRGVQSLNQVKAKIPGLSQTLPTSTNTFGEPKQNYQTNGLQRLGDIFVNPAFNNNYKSNPAIDMVQELYKNTGDTSIFPQTAPKNFSYKGEKVNLTPQEVTDMQQFIGQKTMQTYNDLATSDRLKNASDEGKIKELRAALQKIYDEGKNNILWGRGLK